MSIKRFEVSHRILNILKVVITSLNYVSESKSDMYSASINEDYYAEAGVVSKGSVRHVTERIGSGKMIKDSEVIDR